MLPQLLIAGRDSYLHNHVLLSHKPFKKEAPIQHSSYHHNLRSEDRATQTINIFRCFDANMNLQRIVSSKPQLARFHLSRSCSDLRCPWL